MSEQQLNGKSLEAPPETGAVSPPHPKMYDCTRDEMRPVAQEDYDAAHCAAEADHLRKLLIRRLLGWDRDKLREARKLLDDKFGGPRNA